MSMPSSTSEVTRLLQLVGQGDDAARERLWRLIYQEIRRMARSQMRSEGRGGGLQTTILINEAYLRLSGDGQPPWANRRHFFAAAAQAMRRIRADSARKSRRIKRGGGQQPVPLEEEPPVFDQDPLEVLAVHEALDGLEAVSPRAAEVVKLRYFAGLTVRETAEVLELAPRTVVVDWQFARAWLHRACEGRLWTERDDGPDAQDDSRPA